ncbi:MAG: MATE family efflux transporter [Oribacterium sp.]|jgi:putative MATE family efflux protein|nr:MATE family efflux transporter [Oribacterium sp.]
MEQVHNFTEGKILKPLLSFMLPVLAALFLQAMYGAVDLLVVGHFGTSEDVSGVSTGSMLLMTLTNVVTSFSMGVTVALGQQIGRGETEKAGDTIGTGITFFGIIAIMLTFFTIFGRNMLAGVMNAPAAAFTQTTQYISICGAGFLVIVAYNILGSIFRGLGDSKTPLMAVGIACVANIFGDLYFVSVLHMGAAGAALATVLAQLLSVIVSLVLISRRSLPFAFTRHSLRPQMEIVKRILAIGFPIALQDFLVGMSFLVIMAIINRLGVDASAGVGVAEKVCGFIMLVPSAFMQSMAAFVAQNIGAAKYDRSYKTLSYGIRLSFMFGVLMFFLSFFHGDILCGFFTKDAAVIAQAADYLKAYSIDCLLTCFLFCFIGFYNGAGETLFVMAQGIIGAFCVRIPVAFAMSRLTTRLFFIGLATPCSTITQIILCLIMFRRVKRKYH